jgi:hypothetical protein
MNEPALIYTGAIHYTTFVSTWDPRAVAYPGILFGGGSTNSVEDRENGDLGAVAP